MRIGLVTEHFQPAVDRCGKWAYQLARELLSRGHEVHVVAQSFGAESERLPIVAHALGRIRSPLALAAAMGQKAHSLTLDLIHDFGAGWYCDVFQPFGGSPVARHERSLSLCPAWLQSVRQTLWPMWPGHQDLERLWVRQYVNDGRLFVVPSRRVADDLTRCHGVPKDLIRRVYGGVDTVRYTAFHRDTFRQPIRQRMHLDDHAILVLHLGDHFRMDGLQTVLKAVARLVRLHVPVHLLAGNVQGAQRPMRWAAAMGLSSRVTFTGPLNDLAPLYAAADVYVQPTVYDPNGMTTLEALASGLPVITTEFNGISELITDGRQGYVLDDPADFATLADHIQALCDPAARATMAQASRQLALRRTLAKHVEELTAVYDEAVRNQQARTSVATDHRGQSKIIQPVAGQQRVIHEHAADPAPVSRRSSMPPRVPARGDRFGRRSGET